MDLYSVFIVTHPKGTLVWFTQFYRIVILCLYLVSVHRMVIPVIVVADI